VRMNAMKGSFQDGGGRFMGSGVQAGFRGGAFLQQQKKQSQNFQHY